MNRRDANNLLAILKAQRDYRDQLTTSSVVVLEPQRFIMLPPEISTDEKELIDQIMPMLDELIESRKNHRIFWNDVNFLCPLIRERHDLIKMTRYAIKPEIEKPTPETHTIDEAKAYFKRLKGDLLKYQYQPAIEYYNQVIRDNPTMHEVIEAATMRRDELLDVIMQYS